MWKQAHTALRTTRPTTYPLTVVTTAPRIGVFTAAVRCASSTTSHGPAAPVNNIDWDSLGFGLTRVDYMYVAETAKGSPFAKGDIKPYGPLQLEPASTVLNYGQGLFEGIKAFRTSKGRIVIFRPEDNWKRMNAGAARFLMPPIPKDVFFHALNEVVKRNSHYVPPLDKGALYLRPLLFGSGAQLGVSPSPSYTFVTFASPVGSYFKGGRVTPISLLVPTTVHRAAPKGSGDVKAIGNYAPCFAAQKSAKDDGFSEILVLDAREDKYVEEAGASNFFCVLKDGTIVTPGLHGSILPGVTRESVITLLRDRGHNVISNKKVAVTTACSAVEAFCTGTGASVTPVGFITYDGTKHALNDGKIGDITKQVTKALLDTQMERVEDKFSWLHDPWAQ